MAFEIKAYQFDKKVNSTEIPNASTPVRTYSAMIIKDNCSILTPTIKMDVGTATFGFIPNYAYIAIWDRYYYVTDIQWDDGIWLVSLKVDVLASYKTEIGIQSLYVTRSSAQSDGSIIDTTYPAEGVPSVVNQLGSSPWNLDQDNGYCYVMGIAGKSTTYYAFTLSQLEVFLDYVMSDAYVDALYGSTLWATNFPEIKAMTNPLQYITSIKWYPFQINGSSVTSIQFGWVNINIAGGLPKEITNFLNSDSNSITINNKHPQAVSRGVYLNNAPYSNFRLLYPGFGQIDLDTAIVSTSASIFTSVIVDVRTGDGTLYIEDDSLYVLNQITSKVGVEYQIGQTTKQGFGIAAMAQTALGTLGSALSGDIGGTIGSASGSLGNYARSQIPSIKTIGTNGGVNNLSGVITLQSEFKLLVAEDNTRKGRPLCMIKTLNTLSGFIQIDKADINIIAMESENKEIKSYMEGGFYYE